MKEQKKKIGKRIRFLRKCAGLTQEALGEKTELNYKYIGELERGHVNVSLKSLEKIAIGLKIDIKYLFLEELPSEPIDKKKNSKFSQLEFNIPHSVDRNYKRGLEILKQLRPETREIVVKIMDALLLKDKIG